MHAKNAIRNWLLRHLLNAVLPEDVVTTDKRGAVYLNGSILSEQEKKNILEEIKFIETTRIWKIYTESLKEQAQRRIFDNAKTIDDIFAGKMMLYNIDVILKINNIFKER